MLNLLRLAWRLFLREWMTGGWLIIFFSLLLAVTATSGFHLYTNRLTKGLEQQSTKLLGGDLVISSSMPIPQRWKSYVENLGLNSAEVWSYPSVINTKNKIQFVNLQAVSSNYPLLGNPLELKPHAVLVEPRILNLLSLTLNSMVGIGAANFKIENILPSDLDLLNTGWLIAPRVLINIDDVPQTKTVLPGSRVDYRMLITGETQKMLQLKKWLKPQLSPSQRLIDINDQNFSFQNTLSQAKNYIELVLLLCLLMSGIAIALSVRQFLERHYAYVALWRALGANNLQITFIFIFQLAMLGIVTGVLGLILGFILQESFVAILKSIFRFSLPLPDIWPFLLGFSTSLFLLFTYAYPIIGQLPKVSPLYLWRKEVTINSLQKNIYLIIALGILIAYIYWSMNFSLLALFFLTTIIVSVAFLQFFILIILYILKQSLRFTTGIYRRGLSNLLQHPESSTIQIIAITFIVMSALILNIIKNDLVFQWEASVPKNSPNFFAFNIAKEDLESMHQFFINKKLIQLNIYPMVRGRLIQLNGKPIMENIPVESRQHNALHRELNLSAMLDYPADNKIVQGDKWSAHDKAKHLISIEQKLAQDLNLKIGDQLTFNVENELLTGAISNIRSVNWSSFHPNFYVIFPPDVIDKFSLTYITSFHLLPEQIGILNQLVEIFPSITIINVADILNEVQALLLNITESLKFLFIFVIGAAILIFITTIITTMDERKKTHTLLYILGASKYYIRGSTLYEFGILIVVGSMLGIGLAKVISFMLLKVFFNL